MNTRTILTGALLSVSTIAAVTTCGGTAAAPVITPVPAAYRTAVRSAGALCPQITPALIAATLDVETGWNANAKSTIGDLGPGQLPPALWAEYARDDVGTGTADPTNPVDGTMAVGRALCAIATDVDTDIAQGKVHPNATGLYLAAYNTGQDALLAAHGMPTGGDYTTNTQPYVHRALTEAAAYTAAGV